MDACEIYPTAGCQCSLRVLTCVCFGTLAVGVLFNHLKVRIMICNQCKYYDRGNGYCSMRDQDFAPHAGCEDGRSKWDDEDECYSDDEDEDGDWDD